MARVCILGCANSWKDAPFNEDIEIWTLNHRLCGLVPRFDRHFDVHIPYKNYHQTSLKYFEFLKLNQKKLWIMDKSDDFRDANIIDWRYLIQKYGRYFTSSIAWMLALAIEAKYEEIQLHGVELRLKEEYEEQRACIEYFLGVAQGAGIKILVNNKSILLNPKGLYGID